MAAQLTVAVVLVAAYLLIPLCLYVFAPTSARSGDLDQRRRRAIVLVLGDIGRSPRMMYHARSLARGGVDVELCGYDEGSQVLAELVDSPRVTIHRLPVIKNTLGWPFVVFAVQKVLWQHYYLVQLLRQLKGADFLLVQNPPSIPTLGVAKLFIIFISRHTKLFIDWHNLGYSILGLKLGKDSLLVRIYQWYEQFFGSKAYCHFTVSVRMGQVLKKKFKMRARRIVPLHDRPASTFSVLTEAERQEVKLAHPYIFGEKPVANEKVVITSTSYTPDENLYTLLDALKEYDVAASSGKLPSLRVIVTGKGPMYTEMQTAIAQLNLSSVSVHQVWLAIEAYPRVLGVADLGVSLHESSSGWDLPMKIVDMFGCGVPVVAIGYPALPELVKENDNGLIVDDSAELAQALTRVFSDKKVYDTIKRGAVRESRLGWDSNWLSKVGPLFGIGEYAPTPEGYVSESSSSSDSE